MNFLRENCTQYAVTDKRVLVGFSCGDKDLDEFFTNDCIDFTKQLLGKTYCYRLNEDPSKVVCAFTLANAGIRVSDRFMIVDAYNETSTMAFYEQNGFKTVFSAEQQEKDYRHITSETSLSTRLMYYDLMKTVEEYM